MDKKSGLSGKMEDGIDPKAEAQADEKLDAKAQALARKKAREEGREVSHVTKKAPKVIAVHTLTDKETWSHLALRYYGDMSEPYWRYMYEFNKEKVGDNYKAIWGGMEIEIPELPDHLKKDKDE